MGVTTWPNTDPDNNNATVRAATTANITIATALNNGDTLDGVVLATGNLVLVKDQSTPAQNGVYTVGITPVRAPNYDTYNEYPGIIVSVTEGTTNANKAFVCTSDAGGTLGTTAISFAAFGPGTIIGSVGSVDNVVPRANGTGGLTLQDSTVIIADTTGVISGTQGVTFSGSTSGTTEVVPTGIASGTITLPAATGTVALVSPEVNAQVGTTYALVAADNGKVVTCDNGAAIALSVPAGLGAGFNCLIIQLGAGAVTITPDTTTINGRNGLITAGQYAEASLFAIAANTFIAGGDLTT